MKKTILLCLTMAACLATQAQTQTQKQPKLSVSEVKATAASKAENYAQLKFDTLAHDFGKFSAKKPIVKCTFPFVNTGTAPLVIHQAFASCGCTIPSYPKAPIKPGEGGVIEVTYDGTDKFPGHFQKTITIRSNAVDEVVRLTIEGTME